MAIRLTLKSAGLDEVAKWRKTAFDTELTQEVIDGFVKRYGADLLGVHYDDGVFTGKGTPETFKGMKVAKVEDELYARSRGEETVPQTSFNPKAQWNTPVGIYYYPLTYALDKIMANTLPFARDKKFVYIYKIKNPSKRIDVSDMPYNGFVEKLLAWASKNKDLSEVLDQSGVAGFSDTLTGEIVDLFSEGKPKPPAGTVAKMLAANGADEQQIVNTVYYMLNNAMDRVPARVTKYLLSQGYEVFEDSKNTGSIHTSEATQGIYLTPGAVQLLGSYKNRFSADRQKSSKYGSKEVDPTKIGAILIDKNGAKIVDKALEITRSDPSWANSYLEKILKNPDITKDKKLGDKIVDKINPSGISTETLSLYLYYFAPLMSIDHLERNLGKFLDAGLREKLNNLAYDRSSYLDYAGDAIAKIEREYGSIDYEKYPNLGLLNQGLENIRIERDVNDVLSNSSFYKAGAGIEVFLRNLKTRLASGQIIPPETVANNFLDGFHPRLVEDRIEFVTWVFDNYPQFLENRRLVIWGLKNLKYWSELDTDKSEEIMKDSEIYKKLTAAKADLDAKKEAEEKKKLAAESLYRWDPRLKQYKTR